MKANPMVVQILLGTQKRHKGTNYAVKQGRMWKVCATKDEVSVSTSRTKILRAIEQSVTLSEAIDEPVPYELTPMGEGIVDALRLAPKMVRA